jgi:hypothetical protein
MPLLLTQNISANSIGLSVRVTNAFQFYLAKTVDFCLAVIHAHPI